MKVLICGDRNFTDYPRIFNFVKQLKQRCPNIKLIEGGQKGADTLAKKAAEELEIPCKELKADWKNLGKAAGHIRNKRMLDEENPDLVVAFHDNIEKSKGTKNMINQAKKKGIEFLHVINLEEEWKVT